MMLPPRALKLLLEDALVFKLVQTQLPVATVLCTSILDLPLASRGRCKSIPASIGIEAVIARQLAARVYPPDTAWRL